MQSLQQTLIDLGAQGIKGSLRATDEMLAAFEREFQIELPPVYREFLSDHGAQYLEAFCPIDELNPFGDSVGVDALHGLMQRDDDTRDIRWWTRLVEGAGLTVPIASDAMGGAIFMICSGPENGHVLFRDPQGRSTWSDERFHKMFKSLSPKIENYLERRRRGEVPPKARPNFYWLAFSFADFMGRCRRSSGAE